MCEPSEESMAVEEANSLAAEPDDWGCQQVGYHLRSADEARLRVGRHTAAECRATPKPEVSVALTNGEVQYLTDLMGIDAGPDSHASQYGVDTVALFQKFIDGRQA